MTSLPQHILTWYNQKRAPIQHFGGTFITEFRDEIGAKLKIKQRLLKIFWFDWAYFSRIHRKTKI